MKPPARQMSPIEEGVIDSLVRQLMSGKEAMLREIDDAGLVFLAHVNAMAGCLHGTGEI